LRLGPVVVNAFGAGDDLQVDHAAAGTPLRAAAEFRNARRGLHRRESKRLAETLDRPHICLPLITEAALDTNSIERLAAELGARS
jgi:hypothetical protein